VVLVGLRAFRKAIVQQFVQQSKPGNCVLRDTPARDISNGNITSVLPIRTEPLAGQSKPCQ
jgi:hypothetical protein